MAKKMAAFDKIHTQVLVVGAGASGLAAAITAAEAGASVTILEHKKEAGKKILITGNGRCNLGNLNLSGKCYRSSNPSFLSGIPGLMDSSATTAFFARRGIITVAEGSYLYPASGQAASVRDTLIRDAHALGAKLITGCAIREISLHDSEKERFEVKTNLGTVFSESLILATGGAAAPSTGSDGSGFAIARHFGHKVIPVLPALVQLVCREKDLLAELAGIRFYGKVTLRVHDKPVSSDEGEIQLTDYGISGIPVFQVSRYASCALADHEPVTAVLDFWPAETGEETGKRLIRRKNDLADRYSSELLIGWFHRKIGDLFLLMAQISRNIRIREIPDEKLMKLIPLIHDCSLTVTGTNSFESAQVSCGGVDTAEVDPATMASRRLPGLYFAGEILDVDGICGGYNLHFAWVSGQIAGKSAAGAAACRRENVSGTADPSKKEEILSVPGKTRDKLHPEVIA